jgi:FkbM family methyltransferase
MDSRESIIRQSKFQRVLQYIEKFGFFTAMRLVLSLKMGKGQATFKYGKNVLYIRKGTSDVQAFEQIFLLDDYDIKVANVSPRLIVDAGANVGYASLYFANRYPGATIVAVEPESQNYQLLCKNTAGYPNIKAVKSAVWNEDTHLRVVDQGLGSWGFTVESCGPGDPGAFKATSIGTLLSDTGESSIDILKMDIEGAEKEVFTTNYQQWLPNVSVMIVELHDRIKAGTSDVFYKAIEGQNFSIQEKGENLILSKVR